MMKIGSFRLEGCRILQAVLIGFPGLGQGGKRGKFEMFQQQKTDEIAARSVSTAAPV